MKKARDVRRKARVRAQSNWRTNKEFTAILLEVTKSIDAKSNPAKTI